MKFKAEIDVMPLKSLLDPQGKAVSASMGNVGLAEIENVRIGKHITLEIEANNEQDATSKVDEACKKCFVIKSWSPLNLPFLKRNYSLTLTLTISIFLAIAASTL